MLIMQQFGGEKPLPAPGIGQFFPTLSDLKRELMMNKIQCNNSTSDDIKEWSLLCASNVSSVSVGWSVGEARFENRRDSFLSHSLQ